MADSLLIDTSIKNNHAGVKRLEDSERAEALLRIINNYRMHTVQYEQLPSWDVLEFLQKLDDEVNERYNKEVENGIRDKIKEQYFLLTHKKPFMGWSNERILEEMEKYKNKAEEITDFKTKKSRWKDIK